MKVQRLVGEYFIYNKPTTKTPQSFVDWWHSLNPFEKKGGKG